MMLEGKAGDRAEHVMLIRLSARARELGTAGSNHLACAPANLDQSYPILPR